jgi:zinc transporter ZupT
MLPEAQEQIRELSRETRSSKSGDDKEARKRSEFERSRTWRRVMLLVIAITVHNFPEGLAVGVGFGAIGTRRSPPLLLPALFFLPLPIAIHSFIYLSIYLSIHPSSSANARARG